MHVCGRHVGAAALLVANLLLAAVARADETTIARDQRKDRNAYRGRLGKDHVDEPFLWIPRVVFFPFYLIAEFVIRRPIYAFVEWSDRHHIVPKVMRIMHPTPDFEWNPTLNVDFGVEAWVGAHFTLRNLFVRRNELSSTLALGFNVFDFEARDEWRGGPVTFGVRQHVGRHNRPFYGLGPDSPDEQTNYTDTQWDVGAYGAVDVGKHARVEVSETFRKETLGPSSVEPSIETVFDTATLPGFENVHLATLGVGLRVDSRKTEDEPSGVRLLANLEHARDVVEPDLSFLEGTVDAQAALEVSRPGRVVSVRFYGADTLPSGTAPVPLTDLPMLGGTNHLGFYWGRFRGESAVMAELRYRYPIAYDGDAQIVLSAGNVFARDLHDFDVAKLTASFAVGLRTRRAGLLPLQVLLGFGTTRFDQPFAVDSVRLFIGTDLGL
jgi:hypothetical protein